MVSLLNLYGPLRIDADVVAPEAIIRLVGEFDFACDRSLETCDNLNLAGVQHLTLDLRGLDFLDSVAYEALLGFVQRHRAIGRDVEVINARQHIRRICHILGGTDELALSDRQSA